MSPTNNKVILRQAVPYFADTANREQYFNLYADDCVLHMPGLPPGLEGIKAFYQSFWAGFPDAQLTVADIIAEADLVACRYILRATHRGEFNGIPATGRAIQFEGITILRFDNGRCIERWNQADFLSLLQQIGAMPIPAG